jgi:apolipoprotein D and lipocalin family protein
MKVGLLAVAGTLLMATPCLALGRGAPTAPLDTVASVDLERYAGLWYEIARLPQSFEKDCAGVTAFYSKRPDGKIDVENRCRKGALDGPEKIAHGVARVVDEETRARLKVSFFWPFSGDYWILELGADYEYSVVGAPDRKSLWILSRTPRMDEAQIRQILDRRAAQGFDVSRMERTIQ